MTKKINDLEDSLGYWLRCLSEQALEFLAKKLEIRGISVSQWLVLRVIYDFNEINLNEIASKVGVDKSTMSRMVERLVQKGLLMRIEGQNRRAVCLKLTLSAKNLVPKLAKIADEHDKQFFKSLTVGQQEELLVLIKKLLIANKLSLK